MTRRILLGAFFIAGFAACSPETVIAKATTGGGGAGGSGSGPASTTSSESSTTTATSADTTTSSTASSSSSGGGTSCGGIAGESCAPTEYCKYPDGNCDYADGTGFCTTRPDTCQPDDQGVCGCDGNPYASACLAAANGTDVYVPGGCE